MKIILVTIGLSVGFSPLASAQSNPVEKEKFVFLNNGVTIGMIVNSVLKADKQRLKLTDAQLPKARQIITDATKYSDRIVFSLHSRKNRFCTQCQT